MTSRTKRLRRAKWAAGLAAGLASAAAWSELVAQPPAFMPERLPQLEPTPRSHAEPALRDDVRRTNYPQPGMQPPPGYGPAMYPMPPAYSQAPTTTPFYHQQVWSQSSAPRQSGPMLPVNWDVSQPTPTTMPPMMPQPPAQPQGPPSQPQGPSSQPPAQPQPQAMMGPQGQPPAFGSGQWVYAPSPGAMPVPQSPPQSPGYWPGPGSGGAEMPPGWVGGPSNGPHNHYGYGHPHAQKSGWGFSNVRQGIAGAGHKVLDSTVGLAAGSVFGIHEKLKDCMFGYPENFVEPPLGAIRDEVFRVQRSKADIHKFTLYRSDFLAGTDKLSPTGASRLNLMASRINGWLGPVMIEWTPEDPALGEARKAVVLTMLQNAGLPVVPERMVVGPSSTIGLPGAESDVQYNQRLTRYQGASPTFPLPPQSSSSLQQASGGGGS